MEFVIQKSVLVHELQTVTGVVERRATLPILANLLIETQAGGVRLGASDLEVTIRGTAKAEVVREGGVTLPAGKLYEIARSLPDAEITFKLLDRNQVSITCERTRYRIPGQSREDFPQFPEFEASKGIRLPGSALKGMIERVAFAITTEDPRYSMHGALLVLSGASITLVATDGFRLAYVTRAATLNLPDKGDLRVIVPRKALGEIAKLAGELADGQDITFGREGNQIFFHVGTHVLTSTVPEAVFPKYEEVMPKSCDTQIVLPTADLTDAVRRVALVASDRLGRTIKFHISRGQIELSTATEAGEAQEVLPIEYSGDEKTVGFSARYLQEFLTVVESPAVRFELDPRRGDDEESRRRRAGDRQAQFRPEPKGDLDYRYIVMPRDL